MSLNMIRPFVINPGTIRTKKSHLCLKNVNRYKDKFSESELTEQKRYFSPISMVVNCHILYYYYFEKLKGSEGHTLLVWLREWELFQLEHLHTGIVIM